MSDTTDPIGVKDTSESDEPIRDTADHTQSLTMAGADLAKQTVTSSVAPAPAPITEFIIAEGGSAEIDGAGSQLVTFTGVTGTLRIDHALGFSGQISGLAGADALDLADISYGADTTASFLGNTSGGTLTVTDGSHTANITLTGNYLSSGWTLSSDGQGGTVVVDPVPVNAWKELKIGAGGFITGIDIAPDDTMVIRTDTYGAYIWNGTQWQQLVTSTSMPAADVTITSAQGVYEVQIAPSNTNILYMMYNGYVYRSADKGTTWTKTSFAHIVEDPNVESTKLNGQKMAVDPNNPNVVYVGTPQNGLFVTTDGGASWQSVNMPVGAQNSSGQYPGITGIVFDPTSGSSGGKTNVIYASSYGNGAYKSTNGGASWTALSGGPSDVDYATISRTGVYYAIGNNNTSLWRNVNGTWTNLLTSSNGNNFATVAIDPFNPSDIVVQTQGGNIEQSLDGGATWGDGIHWNQQLSATDVPWLATTNKFMGVSGATFDQLVPNKLWVSAGVGVWNTTLPQNLTWQNTIVWNSQSVGIEQLVANEIVVAPGGKPVVGSWDRSFFYVSDPNAYPSTYGVGAPNGFSAGWSIDYASSNPSFLVGINDWWGVEQSGYSTDGGQTWHMFPTMPSFAGTTIGGTIAASSPTDIVWAPADGVAPQYTKDGGITWHPVVLPGVTDWSTFDFAYYLDKRTVTADRVLPDTFYMYYVSTANTLASGVYKSTDGGATWTQVHVGEISLFSASNSRIESVPGEAGNLLFTGGPQGVPTHPAGEPFYQSTDGGTTWTAIPNVLEVTTFGFGAPATPGGYPSIYIVGYVNSVYGIWQSNDDAHSWTMIGDYPNGSLDQIRTIAGDPNIYGQVYVGFAGSGYAYLPAASAGPAVTAVATSPSSGDLSAGHAVTLTLNLSSAVTVAGGTPTLALNDGGTATYTGGSGTNALTFSYTVGAGQNTPDLAVTAVNPGTATIKDGSGNAANLAGAVTNPAGTLQIDTTPPVISSIAESPSSGDLNAGKTVAYTLAMSEVVTVNTTGGNPTLTLNDGGTAIYTGGSGTSALTFSYTVLAGQNTPDLMVSVVNLNGATLLDGAGNAANLSLTGLTQGSPQIDTTSPTVTQVIASPANGSEFPGNTITFTLAFGEAVTVTGTPTLTLNDGGTATYVTGTGTNALTYSYTVGSNDTTVSALAITQANLPNGATITDGAGNAANLSGALTTFPNLSIDPPVIEQAPVVTALNPTLTHNQSIAASSLFTAADPEGDTITTYALKDVTGNGHFVVNGVVQATNTEIDLTAAQLAQTTYQSGSGSDQISMRASDGTLWSGWQTATVTAPVDQAPVVTTSNKTVTHNQSIAASLLFTAADPDGDTITTYALKDVTGNGHFVVNGVVQASNVEIDLTAAQLAQTTYVAGSATDQLSVRASDGTLWGAWQSATATVSTDQAPMVTALNTTVKHKQSVAASSLFTAVDPEGDTITTYALKDVTGNGHFVVNGVVQAANVEIDLTAAQLAQTTYQSGSGSDQFSVRAFDGTLWSGWQTATVTAPLNQAPVVKASNKTLTYSPHATSLSTASSPSIAASSLSTPIDPSVAASSLFTATDPDGDPITTYALKDMTGNGYFVVNGVAQATNVEIDLTSQQLAQTTYQSGSGPDQLSISAFDGTTWSAWQNFTVAGPVVTVVETSGSTNLTRVGTNFYLFNSGGSGPALQYAGAAVVARQFGAWTAIGAEATATGFQVAWKNTGTNQYTVWNTDSGGKYVSGIGAVAESSTALESLETAFQQDLNGDGTIGLVTTVIEARGSTSLTEVGDNFYLGASGPQLKYAGAAVVAGQFGAWTAIGAEATATGYQVAWKNTGTNQYTAWNTDSGGKYVSGIGAVAGSSTALESLDTAFQQDLNGDGTIGLVTTVIEARGSTSLTEVGDNFYLGASGPQLKYAGAAVVAGQFGASVAIGAEATATGYQVAWKLAGTDQYTVWNTDSSGKYVSGIGAVAGSSTALESLETAFQQDLNGDGTIGLVTTVIEARGATSLTEVGNNFYLGASGPQLKYAGAAVVAGQFGASVAIGAEATATGYQVAWKLAGTDQYTVWNTDSSGKYVSGIGAVAGSSTALESLETAFQQDLNGDGTIGLVTTVIEARGSTSLTEVGDNFYLGGSGPQLKYAGAAVVAGQFGAWTAIGAEATATGYQVAWKNTGTNQYTVWNTDSSGKYVSTIIGTSSGSSTALESLETAFQQDLNGDGTIGLPATGTPAAAAVPRAPIIVSAGANVEIPTAYAGKVTFSAATGTLKLDHSSSFSGTVAGMSGQDRLDLADINFATLQQPVFSGNTSGGTLSVTDGAHTANIALLGNYMASTFVTSSDGHGGTYVVDPSVASQNNLLAQPQHV